jgi:N-acetylmuramate 1-kinase
MLDPKRMAALSRFAATALGVTHIAPESASADASFRSYWRVRTPTNSFVVMNAPPEKEDTAAFINVAHRLRDAGLHAPEVIAKDVAQGFLLLSDLGTEQYLPALNQDSVAQLYGDAFNALHAMRTMVYTDGLAPYDDAKLRTEMELLPMWFIGKHLGHRLQTDEFLVINTAFDRLLACAAEQPKTFVHRDFHSRNLMVVPTNNPGILDFQDAVIGPITYDLVSLLKDCYIRWPVEQVDDWVEQFRERIQKAGQFETQKTRFKRWFDWMGLQRHLKVLGIFSRLNYRDSKTNYLNDLPLVWQYVREVCSRYGELSELGELLERIIAKRDLTKPWSA